YSPYELAQRIDHTLLKPDAPEAAVRKLCREARTHGFISVCILPCWVSVAQAELEESGVRVGTVIGFPLGANATAVKVIESEEAMRDGADELDMVLNVSAVKSAAWEAVEADIGAVVAAATAGGAEVKVILECAYLTEAEKRQAAQIVAGSGAAFVKTSTGFGPGGATLEDVRLLKEIAGGRCGVKAAGGIRDMPAALAMLDAGATRLGTSAGLAILQEAQTSGI
ncbi:MAG TPA: deoxyribose-phosphate aldolase, partial [Chthonomonadaceae bacterium]|nr:deoxyribose-phosphate aldolase [Chthonomonadaceae bacterium]